MRWIDHEYETDSEAIRGEKSVTLKTDFKSRQIKGRIFSKWVCVLRINRLSVEGA